MFQDIINFWFRDIEQAKWFVADDAFDDEIRSRFADTHNKVANCEQSAWRATAEGSLAEIIVLDQFSRNLFRGSATSFATDSLALALAQFAIAKGLDNDLDQSQRSFMYMPFMHSESLAIHQTAVQLFTTLGNEQNLEFEIKHRDIIERFGRYPHRNSLLGRDSTPEELEFLAQPGSSF